GGPDRTSHWSHFARSPGVGACQRRYSHTQTAGAAVALERFPFVSPTRSASGRHELPKPLLEEGPEEGHSSPRRTSWYSASDRCHAHPCPSLRDRRTGGDHLRPGPDCFHRFSLRLTPRPGSRLGGSRFIRPPGQRLSRSQLQFGPTDGRGGSPPRRLFPAAPPHRLVPHACGPIPFPPLSGA